MGKGLPRSLARSDKFEKAAVIDALSGLSGAANNTLENVTDVATSGGNTYADSAINAKLALIRNNFLDLQSKINELIAALKA